jgi:hypothetical protein
MRRGHPRSLSAEYIGFSKSFDDLWFFVADQFSGRPEIRQITVEKRFHHILQKERVSFRWETAGGQNIFVSIDDVPMVLSMLQREITETPELRSRPPLFDQARIKTTGILSESDLQKIFTNSVASKRLERLFGGVKIIRENPSFFRSASTSLLSAGTDIPDVILETKDTFYVVELKKGEVNNSAVEQLGRYLLNSTLKQIVGERRLIGCLVGHRFSENIETTARGPFANLAQHTINFLVIVLIPIHLS